MTGSSDGPPAAVVASRYRLSELVGTGGMGAVWRARDELLGRDVALKQVRLDPADVDPELARERTMREARIVAALHHPNIVSIF
ncbi:protein kinase domain-containing protein, partial [Pseudonocardia zijingensis]